MQVLKQLLNDLDSGNSNISESEEDEILNLVQKLNCQKLSKSEACDYLKISRSTFDKYVSLGLIPKGVKLRQGITELFWNKVDLDKFHEVFKKKRFAK